MSGGEERHFGLALGGEMCHLAPVCFLFTMKRTLQASCSPGREPGSFLFTAKRTLNAPINYNDAVFPGALNEQNQEQWTKTPFIPDIDLSGIVITQRESLTNILPYTSFPAPSLGFSIGSNEPFQLSSLSFTFYHFLPPSYLSTVPVFHSPPPLLFLIIFSHHPLYFLFLIYIFLEINRH